MSKQTGTIKKLSEKGFGFITILNVPKDLFFHASDLKGVKIEDLNIGDEVEFDGVEPTDKGQKAVGVTIK